MSSIPTSPSQPGGQAQLHLQVASPQAALIRAERLVADYQGTIVRSEFPTLGGARQPKAAARLTCQVSREQLVPLLGDLGRLGKVVSRQVAQPLLTERPASSESAKLEKPLPVGKKSPGAAPSPPPATLTVFFSGPEP